MEDKFPFLYKRTSKFINILKTITEKCQQIHKYIENNNGKMSRQ
jgi:hypothetical protein